MKKLPNGPRLCDELNHWKAVIVTAGAKLEVHDAGTLVVDDGAVVVVVVWHQPNGSLATSGRRGINDWSLSIFSVIDSL